MRMFNGWTGIVKVSAKYNQGIWEQVIHMPSGDKECCFKIKPWV